MLFIMRGFYDLLGYAMLEGGLKKYDTMKPSNNLIFIWFWPYKDVTLNRPYPPFLSSFIYLVVFSPFLVIMVNPHVTDIHSSKSNFQMQWQQAAFILVIFLEEVLGLFEGAGTGRMSRPSITCSPIRTPDRCHHRRHYRQYSHHCRWCD